MSENERQKSEQKIHGIIIYLEKLIRQK